MASTKEYTISLFEIVAVGATCSNFEITWQKDLVCGEYSCTIDNNTKTVEISMPADCTECIEVIIECTDDCTTCEPLPIEICPCIENGDCDLCSECIDNLCVSRCESDEFCDTDGQCVECDDSNPCPDGKECVGGKCICPEGTFDDGRGGCIPCDPANVPNCYICTPDGLKPVECPDGEVCNPDTGDCVECLGSGDCDPNEMCQDGDCICKPGFVRNPVTGECEPEPECDSDVDCPDCEECNQFGTCVPIVCPEGQVCEGGECKTPCENGVDCPDGFGCDPDTGFCEECADQDCTTPNCEKLLGCECNSNGNCVDSDNCNEELCSSVDDCPDGCVCFRGECVDCSNFACDDCTIPGCECVSGNCQEDPSYECTDRVNIRKDDNNCDLIGEAFIEDQCPCDPITITFEIDNKVSNTENTATVDLRFEVRKGLANTFGEAKGLPRLDNPSHPNIADNDLPDSGSVKFVQKVQVAEVDVNDNIIPGTQNTLEFDSTISFPSLSDEVSIVLEDQVIYKKNSIAEIASTRYRILGVVLSAVQNSSFNFTSGSGCIYNASNTVANISVSESGFNNIVNENFNSFNRFKTIFSDDNKNPLFRWSRNNPSSTSYSSSDVYKKEYITASSTGYYKDTLVSPEDGELFSLYGYALEVDCACGDSFYDFGKVKFCQPENLTADFNACNTTIQLDGFEVCDVNQDLSAISGIPSGIQVVFDLFINGNLEYTFQHDDDDNLIKEVGGTRLLTDIINYPEEITSAKLVQRTSDGTICEHTIEVPKPETRTVNDVEVDCSFDTQFKVSIPAEQGAHDIISVTGGGSFSLSGGLFTKTYNKGDNPTVTVTFDDNCTKVIDIQVDCCDARNISVSDVYTIEGSDAIVVVGTINMQFPIEYTIYKAGTTNVVASGTNNNSVDNFQITIENPVKGDYRIVLQDSQGCDEEIETTFSIDIPEPPVLTIANCGDFFTGETKELILRVNADAVGGTLQYTDTNLADSGLPTSTENLVFDTAEKIITVTRSTSFDFVSFDKDGVTYTINKQCEINEVDTPIVTSITAVPDRVCLGDTFNLEIEGTAGATVTISNSVGDVILDSNGEATIQLTPATVGTKTYTVTNIKLGTYNQAVVGPSENIIVSNPPTITASASCDNSNPNSDRVITIEVDDDGGSLVAIDFDTETSLSVTGGSNGDGTSTYTVTLPSSTTVDSVKATYTNSLGCSVDTIQGVPNSCDCPAVDTTATATDVCVGTGDDISFQITNVVVDGTIYSGAQFSVEWFELDGTSLGTSNPINYDTTGLPVSSVQVRYDIEILVGDHVGCTDTGFVSGDVLEPQTTIISSDGLSGDFDGTLCDGGSIGFFSTLEGSSYQWKIDGVNVGADSRFYTFNEGAQPATYELSVEVTDVNGCIATASRDIFVGACDCNVQYVDVQNLESTFTSLETSDARVVNASSSMSSGCYSTDPSGVSTNDIVQSEIETMLTALGEAGAAEVFWQYLEDDCTTRFYVFGSSITLDKLTFSAGSTTYDYLFTQDCVGTDAPGCSTASADNYQAGLNGNATGITITDDGSCFTQYYTALFATDLVGITGNEDVSVVFDGGAATPIAGASATPTTIGSFTYNTYLADQINGLGIDLKAAYPTSSELSNDPASLGTNVDYCTSRVEYIRLYWPVGTTFTIDATSGSFTDVQLTETNSYTARKCSGGATFYTNVGPIGLQVVDESMVP